MEELFLFLLNIVNYRYVLSYVKFKINELVGIISFYKICFIWYYMQLYIIIYVQCICILCIEYVVIDKFGYCIFKCLVVNNIFIIDNNQLQFYFILD